MVGVKSARTLSKTSPTETAEGELHAAVQQQQPLATSPGQPLCQRQQWVQQQGPPRQQWPKSGSPPNFQQHRSNEMSKNTNPTNNTNPILGSSDSQGLFSVEELFQIMTDLIPIAQNCKSRQEQIQKMLQLVPKYFPPCNGGA
jgi:hypothetical protein